MIVDVTQDDIDKGERFRGYACPIALAASRAFKEPKAAMGDGLRDAATWRITHTFTETTRRRMQQFDEGHGMKPFRFRATPVQPDQDVT